MTKPAVSSAGRLVRPILSLDKSEARLRVINLYRAWYKHLPYVVHDWDMPVTVEMLRKRLKEEFVKNSQVKDLRAVDMLVVKGQMELVEVIQKWKQKNHFMSHYFPNQQRNADRPKDFMSKFLSGHET